jgi:hypothetical protein
MRHCCCLRAWGRQPAFAAGPIWSTRQTITDFTVNEDASPNTFDLQSVFQNGVGPFTYAVTANDNTSVVAATVAGATLR